MWDREGGATPTERHILHNRGGGGPCTPRAPARAMKRRPGEHKERDSPQPRAGLSKRSCRGRAAPPGTQRRTAASPPRCSTPCARPTGRNASVTGSQSEGFE
eukprot:158290-Chlamydomonas_euryale.AAC.2